MLSLAMGSMLMFPSALCIRALSLGDSQFKEQYNRAIAAISSTEVSGMIAK
jgi:hypothetical protein